MKNHKILLVDDDLNILGVIASALEHRGYQVTMASGGEAGIEALRVEEFDLVITDLNMPGTDGIAVVKKAKELIRDRGVMILTGSGAPTLVAKVLRVGADDCMLKPCKLTEFWNRVDDCLGRSEVKAMDARKQGHVWGQLDISM